MSYQIQHGDCLEIMRGMEDNSVDAVVTDPPYSSGGFTRDDKMQNTEDKYIQQGQKKSYPSFGGDSRDQRSYLAWCTVWISECIRILKTGGYFLSFTDWRQLPVMTDAVQCGGVFWRGIIVWNKGEGSRAPHKGYFRHQCEYVVWGTKGKATILRHDGPFPGCISVNINHNDKLHMTGKPIELMHQLVRCVPSGGTVLDPFAGSASTGIPCVKRNINFIGIEREAEYVDIARRRINEAVEDNALFEGANV